jgi:Lon protease-like protein
MASAPAPRTDDDDDPPAGDLRGLALFPLSTTLFPQGVLHLRIFEARYLDMVGECMKEARPFGVCRITHGGEAGDAAEHEAIGCLARIIDWDMEKLGLLHIRVQGGQRFRVIRRSVHKHALIRADVALLADDPPMAVPPDLAGCRDLVHRLVARLEADEPKAERRLVAAPYDYESASWIGNRLCEFLPLPPRARQKLMELDEPLTRLYLVKQFLEKEKIL